MESIKNEKEKIISSSLKKIIGRVHSLMDKMTIKKINFPHKSHIKKDKRKFSFDFSPKEINIKEIEDDEPNIKRKYTIENYISINGFVPKLKPKERRIIPSKLLLNKKGINNNKNNILLNINKNFISCPNSEQEDESEYNSSNKILSLCPSTSYTNSFENKFEDLRKPSIKNDRKKLLRTKNVNKLKTHSRKNSFIIAKFENIFNLGFLSGSDEDDDYSDKDIDYKLIRNELGHKNENKKEYGNINNMKYRNRINSWSILNILERKFKLDDD